MSTSGSEAGSIVVKAVLHGSTRRIRFAHSAVDYVTFRSKIGATFSLPPSGFKLSFRDDDGDDIEICSQACLHEAITFFSDDETASSSASSRSGSARCVMRVNVSVDYDGPRLSEYEPSRYSDSDRSGPSSVRRRDRRHHRDGRRGFYDESVWSGEHESRRDSHYESRHDLRSSVVRRAPDGKHDFSQRWLAQLPLPPASTTGSSSSFVMRAKSSVDTGDAARTYCCACRCLSENQRYICSVCGPVRAEKAGSDDGTERDAPSRGDLGDTGLALSYAALPPGDPGVRTIDGPTESSSSSSSSDHEEDKPSPATSLGADDPHAGFELCAACVRLEGANHARDATAPGDRHAFREVVRDLQGSWREVVFDDVVDCSSCGGTTRAPDRFKCLTCARFDLCRECFQRHLHIGHAFQSMHDRLVISINSSSLGPPAPLENRFLLYRSLSSLSSSTPSLHTLASSAKSSQGHRHVDSMCFGCLREVVGIRYHCADCQIDLCEACESTDPTITMPHSDHELSHILLKISVPMLSSADSLQEAIGQARHMERESRGGGRRGRSPGSGRDRWQHDIGPPPPSRMRNGYDPPYSSMAPPTSQSPHHFGYMGHQGPPGPPPFHHHHWPPPPHHGGGPWGMRRGPPQPSVYLINTAANPSTPQNGTNQLIALPPTSTCAGCTAVITGERWLCASCPTAPPYELCSTCEPMAADFHEPSHIFLHVRRAPTRRLPPGRPLLPPLYDEDALDDVMPLHRGISCGDCAQQVSGIWMRCGSCPQPVDLCSSCYDKTVATHDQTHAFAKFIRSVDFGMLRGCRQPILPSSIFE